MQMNRFLLQNFIEPTNFHSKPKAHHNQTLPLFLSSKVDNIIIVVVIVFVT